jgi:hypothetical protein
VLIDFNMAVIFIVPTYCFTVGFWVRLLRPSKCLWERGASHSCAPAQLIPATERGLESDSFPACGAGLE